MRGRLTFLGALQQLFGPIQRCKVDRRTWFAFAGADHKSKASATPASNAPPANTPPISKSVEYKGNILPTFPKPCRKTLNVIGPRLEGHVLESSSTFPNTAIVVAENFDSLGGQIARPLNPRTVGSVTL